MDDLIDLGVAFAVGCVVWGIGWFVGYVLGFAHGKARLREAVRRDLIDPLRRDREKLNKLAGKMRDQDR